jgi:hypothetical protein
VQPPQVRLSLANVSTSPVWQKSAARTAAKLSVAPRPSVALALLRQRRHVAIEVSPDEPLDHRRCAPAVPLGVGIEIDLGDRDGRELGLLQARVELGEVLRCLAEIGSKNSR